MRMRLMNCLQMLAAVMMMAALAGCETGVDNGSGNGNGNEDRYPSSTEFLIDNIRVEHDAIKVDIAPENKDMEYIVFISEVKHFQLNSIDSTEELFEDDYMYFREYAMEYNMTVHEFLTRVGWLVKGDMSDFGAKKLYPATDYVVYCYGVEFEGEDNYTPATDVAYKVITTTAPDYIDAAFTIDAVVEGNVANIDIKTNGYDGLYYYYIVDDTDLYFLHDGMELTEEYISHYRNRAYDEFYELLHDDGYYPNSICYSGDMSIRKRLATSTNYMIVVFAVSDEQLPLLCSVPSVERFTTGESLIREISFEIEVSDITPYYAILDITPSTNDEYACVFLSTDQMPNTGDEMEDMEIIIEYYQPAILTGAHHENLTPLMPDTEYIVVAFAIEDELPASHMYSFTFRSASAEKGTTNITGIELLKLYDAEEILAIDRSYAKFIDEAECIAIVEATTSEPTDTLYFWWYEEWHKVEYNDEAFLEDLLMYEPANNPEIMQMWYSIDENDKFFFAGIAEDENGNLGDIYYGDVFLLDKSMTSPAEEFFEWVEGNK